MQHSDIKPARKRSLAEIAYGQILELIMSDKIVLGDKLPSEAALSSALGVSRPITREALLRLQADGLIRTQKGIGSFVSRNPPKWLAQLTDVSDVSGFLRCLEPRIALEVEAARLAAQRRSRGQLANIRKANDELRAEIERGNPGCNEDIAFHAAISIATGNDHFLTLLKSMADQINQVIAIGLEIERKKTNARPLRVVEEHCSIANAIANKDGEAAATFMRHHLLQARTGLTDMYHLTGSLSNRTASAEFD